MFPYRFCLITDSRFIADNKIEDIVKQALDGGVDLIQYRDRHNDTSKDIRLTRALRIREITKLYGAGLVINGDIDLTISAEADGIHLGQEGLSLFQKRKSIISKMFMGISIHNAGEALSAKRYGTDYLIISPVFKPGSKKLSLPPLGAAGFYRLNKLTDIPAFALGGINETNAHIPLQQGAWGVACITGLLRSKDIYRTACKIKDILERY